MAATCFGCKEEIKDKMLEALNKSWHPEHFACKECKKRITENKFHESNGLPVCAKCHGANVQAICAALVAGARPCDQQNYPDFNSSVTEDDCCC